MIRIDKLYVKGYKNIELADLTFNNFNVIIGPNNAGKSNFLQTISFIDLIVNGSGDEIAKYFAGGFSKSIFTDPIPFSKIKDELDDRNGLIEFEIKFSNSESNNNFHYRLVLEYFDKIFADLKFKIKSESLFAKGNNTPGKPVLIFEREGQNIKYGPSTPKIGVTKLKPHQSAVGVLKLFWEGGKHIDAVHSLGMILKTPIFYFSNTELLKSEPSERQNVFNGRTIAFDMEEEILSLEGTDKWGIFTTALKNVLNIEDVMVFKPTFKNEHVLGRKFLSFLQFGIRKTLKDFSDGSILIMALITKVLNSDHDIYFIVEPENSTHPKALVDLINFLQSFSENKQFVITSHSIPILNKTKIDDIITSVMTIDGLSVFHNVKDQKELRSRLKSGYVNFSDELFFANDGEEFE